MNKMERGKRKIEALIKKFKKLKGNVWNGEGKVFDDLTEKNDLTPMEKSLIWDIFNKFSSIDEVTSEKVINLLIQEKIKNAIIEKEILKFYSKYYTGVLEKFLKKYPWYRILWNRLMGKINPKPVITYSSDPNLTAMVESLKNKTKRIK